MKKILILSFLFLVSVASAKEVTVSMPLFNVSVSASNALSIKTTRPNWFYQFAGIKIVNNGYTLSGCTPNNNGYCLFSVSDGIPATVSIAGAPQAITAILCLNGMGRTYSCEKQTINLQTAPPVPPVINSFTANPNAIQIGQSTTLAWASTNATSCTASGGTGSDGWGGVVPTSSVGTIVGPINITGPITYTLDCSGPQGTTSNSVIVNVSSGPPVITSFTATPNSIQEGQSTTLAWASTNTTSCTASGGSSGDGWSGAVPTSSAGTIVGPINTIGNVTYTLNCTGPGGSTSSSVIVNVSALPPVINSFTATPSTIQLGQPTTLAWTSSNTTACTAAGGTSGDGWTGSVPTSSIGTPITPTTTGNITYTLNCSGPGGSTSSSTIVNVNPATVVSIDSFNATPNSIQPGQITSLAWTSTNATSCTGSGGTGTDGWVNTQPISSIGTSIGPISSSVNYGLTCSGPSGTSPTNQVMITVSNSVCGLAIPAVPFGQSAITGSSGICTGCSITGANNTVDSNMTNFATSTVGTGVNVTTILTLINGTSYNSGTRIGFLLSFSSPLSLSNRSNLTFSLLNGTTTVQTINGDSALVDVIGQGTYANANEAYISFISTATFNRIQVTQRLADSSAPTLQIYGACAGT